MTAPAAVTGMRKWNSPYSIGVPDGVEIRVDFYLTTHPTQAGKISIAYPINVPPNPRAICLHGDYKALIARVSACFALLRSKLASDAAEQVSHYLEHGELEMAHEAFVLSCVKKGVSCDKNVADEMWSIGTDLSMETKAVFEVNLWPLAEAYFASASNSPPTPDSPP